MVNGFNGLKFFNKHKSEVHQCGWCMAATAHALVNGLDLENDQERFYNLMCPPMRAAADHIIEAEKLIFTLRAQQNEKE